MKINIARIGLGGLEVSEELTSGSLDLGREDIKFVSNLKVDARVNKTVNVVSAEVEVRSRFLAICSRCLKEVEKDFSQAYKFNYEVSKNDKFIPPLVFNNKVSRGAGFIDLEPDIREEIILGYPVKMLCQPDCKGLCPKCGKDLNLGLCSCKN